jgi:hypothetical protein
VRLVTSSGAAALKNEVTWACSRAQTCSNVAGGVVDEDDDDDDDDECGASASPRRSASASVLTPLVMGALGGGDASLMVRKTWTDSDDGRATDGERNGEERSF